MNKKLTPEEEAKLKEIADVLNSKVDEFTNYVNSIPERFEDLLKEIEQDLNSPEDQGNNNEQTTPRTS